MAYLCSHFIATSAFSKAEDTDEWLTHEQAVKLGLTRGSRMFRVATGELSPGG
jgi:hypothetical protein